MEQDIFSKIKQTAQNAETQDFPNMEKVWSRIDAKLDTKVEKKHNNNWKKLMVAASIALVSLIGYTFFKSDNQIVTTNNEIVNSETAKINAVKINASTTDEVATTTTNVDANATVDKPVLKENADAIIEKQMSEPQADAVAMKEEVEMPKSAEVPVAEKKNMKLTVTKSINTNQSVATSNVSSIGYESKKYDARGVQYENVATGVTEVMKDKSMAKKQDPIVVVDGKISNKNVSNLDDEDIELIVDLKEPLYIINKVEYTEEALFGPNPTSPYAPLKKQKIETFTVLEPEKAEKIYGEKGKKGVVIITTKDGVPRVFKKK